MKPLLPCLLFALLTAATTQPASQPAEKSKTEPARLPIEAKLVVKKDAYVIPEGQSGEAFAKKLKQGANPAELAAKPPEPPAVDLTLEITNNSKSVITIPFGSDSSQVTLKLEGPGAVTVPFAQAHTMEFRMGNPIKIQPGKTLPITIKALKFGNRGDSEAAYWTQPGEYTLTASYTAPIEGLPADKNLEPEQQITITAPPVKLKVTEK